MISKEAKRLYDLERLSKPGAREEKNRKEKERQKARYHSDPEFKAKKSAATKKNRQNMSAEKRAAHNARATPLARERKFTLKGRIGVMLSTARRRSKLMNWYMDIDESDIFIPTRCPVLGTDLTLAPNCDNSPSLDRADNTKGYVKGNVWVISDRANRLKRDGTAAEHEAIARYIRAVSK